MKDTTSTAERTVIFLMRMAIAWIFLYSAWSQLSNPNFSVTDFLTYTKTFHAFFAFFTGPVAAPVTTFLVEYGHLLIGLSLLTGLLVRASSIFAIGLMVLYWMAHLSFPYVGGTTDLLVDQHVVYALVLGLLIAKHAGHILGLDGWVSHNSIVEHNKLLGWATA